MSDWTDRATCRTAPDVDPQLWFPDGYLTNTDVAQVLEAKEWCGWCPVLAECRGFVTQLEAGKLTYERHGVWAAMTPEERYRADPAAQQRAQRARRKAVAV